MMNKIQLCEGLCELHGNILGAAVIEHGTMIAAYSKPDVPVPNEERFKTIFFQTEIIASIHRSNEDFYGPLKFFTVHFEGSDVFFFPLDKYGARRRSIIGFKIVTPYNHEGLVSKVSNFLAENIAVET